jgi:hypothetical protein
MYEIAEKYDVAGLKDLARDKFSRVCGVFWDSTEFVEAAEHAFTTTPDDDVGLRECVIETLSVRRRIIRQLDVRTFLQRRPVLLYGLLAQVLSAGNGD